MYTERRLLIRPKYINPCLFLLQTNLTITKRAERFLRILPKRGYNAMGVFVKALIETGQKHLADLIAPDMCGEYVSWGFCLLCCDEEEAD